MFRHNRFISREILEKALGKNKEPEPAPVVQTQTNLIKSLIGGSGNQMQRPEKKIKKVLPGHKLVKQYLKLNKNKNNNDDEDD